MEADRIGRAAFGRAESLVNFAAALVALVVVRWATRPPDEDHMYGHEKAEYFSAGFEGALIILAAAAIAWVAIERLLHPTPLEDVGVGLAVSAGASLVNLVVGVTLLRAGLRHRSITVEADGRHLLTDVWTSAGVIVGVGVVALTGWERLDPLIALAVAANIVFTGVKLVRRASGGLMDHALSSTEQSALDAALEPYRVEGVMFHAVRTRQSGRRSFVSMHVLVPGRWTVQQGHELLEHIETKVRTMLPETTVFTHIEPLEDPSSFDDATLDRLEAKPGTELRPRVRDVSVTPDSDTGASPASLSDVWRREAVEVAAALGTDVRRGLSDEEAAARLGRFGPNQLEAAQQMSAWRKFLGQFADPLIYLLLAAVVVSLVAWGLEGSEEAPFGAIVIAAIIVANAVLGYVQEARAEQAVAALQRMAAATAGVVRDGREERVPAADVVPGDVLLLAEGDAVAADGRLVEAASLTVGEASLTGESEPVLKEAGVIAEPVGLGDRVNMVFSGTAVARGGAARS